MRTYSRMTEDELTPAAPDEPVKMYLSIDEMSTKFDANKSQLRFWENVFNIPVTRKAKGRRYYSRANVESFAYVVDLLRVRKFTIEGAILELRKRGLYNGTHFYKDPPPPPKKREYIKSINSNLDINTPTKSIMKETRIPQLLWQVGAGETFVFKNSTVRYEVVEHIAHVGPRPTVTVVKMPDSTQTYFPSGMNVLKLKTIL